MNKILYNVGAVCLYIVAAIFYVYSFFAANRILFMCFGALAMCLGAILTIMVSKNS